MNVTSLSMMPLPGKGRSTPIFAVAGGGFSSDWREICPCQNHAAAARRRRGWARGRAAALTVVAGMSFAVVGIPTRAMMLADAPPELTRGAQAIEVVRPRAPFSNRFREHYLDPATLHLQKSLISERVREEFFRTEIPYGSIIYEEAKRHELPPELVAAIVKTESDFRPALRSHKNALGLMQIVPSTGRLFGADDLLDPGDNIRVGARYLKYLEGRFRGDQTMILAAYNAGEGNIARFGGIPPFRETQQYLVRVARNQQRYTERIASRLAVTQATALVIPGSSAITGELAYEPQAAD